MNRPVKGMGWAARLLALAAGLLATMMFPSYWCGRDAETWFEGNADNQRRLALGVKKLVLEGKVDPSSFHNQEDLFNREWVFGSYFAAGAGFAQLGLQAFVWGAFQGIA